jgi:hypothetical protein
MEAHIANLVFRLNDKETLGKSMEIRLRQLQTKKWLHNNPLEIWKYNVINMFKNNLIAQILCITNYLGLEINYIEKNKNNEFKIEGGKYPILWVLGEKYRKNIEPKKERAIICRTTLI